MRPKLNSVAGRVRFRAPVPPRAAICGVLAVAAGVASSSLPASVEASQATEPVARGGVTHEPRAPERSAVDSSEVSSAERQRSPALESRPDAPERAGLDELGPDELKEEAAEAAGQAASEPNAEPTVPAEVTLSASAEKTGASSQAIQVPKGAGTLEGLGESFSMQLSTGVGTFSIPIALPKARGAAQPGLSLSYSSSAGFGVAGVGWDIGVPFIARQTDRGLPNYDDRSDFHFEQDRFVFNGGQELVPVCLVTGASRVCAGAQPGEVMPPWSEGSQYFRARVEGSFLRFFWSSDHLTWRVQDKSGVTMELGLPLDGTNDRSGLELNPDDEREVYRWNLVRQYDAQGDANPTSPTTPPNPVNVVVYRYLKDGPASYLSDVYDTTPHNAATTKDPKAFAHHARLVYEERPDATDSYRPGFLVTRRLRLARVDVTSKTFEYGTTRNRQHLRRYHLSYRDDVPVSLLSAIEVEGRCTGNEADGLTELGDGTLGATSCPRLPPMTFDYTPYELGGDVVDVASSPPHSVDEELSDLFDINSDALPDVLVTAPGKYGAGHAVFFNSDGGVPDRFGGATRIGVVGPNGETASSIRLRNSNVAPLDLDGDSTIDLLHMPVARSYSVYTPKLLAAGWSWVGRPVETADGLSSKIDLGRDAFETRVADVNLDGLVDVIRATGTEIQTFLALGRYAGGNGRFGQGVRTGIQASELSTEPLRSCLPWSGSPVRFGDREIQLADMNGDGLQDIVRLQRGAVRYWPGRGNGYFGTGERQGCAGGTFGEDRDVLMQSSPHFSDITGQSLRLDDVNGDGLDDIVQVRFDAVDLWLNDRGRAFRRKETLGGTPKSPSFANRVRLVDVNGSGTRDILWANGSRYQYIDVLGGTRPFLLTRVENGLGKSTVLEYGTSTAEMLAAARAGTPFDTVMPTVVHVVKRVTTTDNLSFAGAGPSHEVVEYGYRDPLWDGRQREFRGFASATTRRLGDANGPTDVVESRFLLGECAELTAGDGTCSDPSRDNPREALKGLPLVSEKHDEQGVYLSTEAVSYRLRPLYPGRDGRTVTHAFEFARATTLYDTDAGPSTLTTDAPHTAVLIEAAGIWGFDPSPTASPPFGQPLGTPITTTVPLRAATGFATLKTESVVDPFGNRYVIADYGCIAGPACPAAGTGLDAEESVYAYTLPSRPAGDVTGWLHRTITSYATGSVRTEERKRIETVFDARGNPTQTKGKITGTVPMLRTHQSGLSVAPEPPSRSVDNVQPILLTESVYDVFGNVTQQRGANGRCRSVAFDTSLAGGVDGFAQLPVSETLYVNAPNSGFGACSGAPTLVTAAYYDRGIAQLTRVVDQGMQTTTIRYDGFGRLTQLRKPLPDGSLAQESTPWTLTASYDLATAARPYSIVSTSIQDSPTVVPPGGGSPTYVVSSKYIDGLGRTRLVRSEADPARGDDAAWIDSEVVGFDAKGAVARKYLPYFTSGAVSPNQFATVRYDAFGRELETTDFGGVVAIQNRYHALSSDSWDAADLEADANPTQPGNQPGAHYGTYASSRKDGHGRVVATTERIKEGSTVTAREVRSRYLPSGELLAITRVRVGTASPPLVRWMRYDTLGRMVLNVDAHTSTGFTDNVDAPVTSTLRVWRYAYNDAGDLVGTSDARGCGTNFLYDGLGRVVTEDYSPCATDHVGTLPPYSAPNLTTRAGIEVYYQYDGVPTSFSSLPKPTGYAGTSDRLKGRLAAVFDRGSLNYFMYDARGNVARESRRVASPDVLTTALATRYQLPWFEKDFTYDSMDRVARETTGAASTEFLNGSLGSATDLTYSDRGTLFSVSSSYGPLVTSIDRTADGLVEAVVYGDVAATTAVQFYDARRRLETARLERPNPSIWSSPPASYQPPPSLANNGIPTFQNTLRYDDYEYDIVGNPTAVVDLRDTTEWPAGAKPVTRQIQYDDLYRVTNVAYQYGGAADSFVSPYQPERSGLSDSRRPNDFPSHLTVATRVTSQVYEYDWLGSLTRSADNLNALWDRGMGPMRNHDTTGRPYQWRDAGDLADPAWPGTGSADAVEYDAAGNLKQIRVQRTGACTNGTSTCNLRFYYYYDEIGRLYRGQRFESTTLRAEQNFVYDSSDARVIKSDVLASGTTNDPHTLYVFDTLELRRALHNATTSTYTRSNTTEVPYLLANGVRVARLVYEGAADGEPRLNATTGRLHVFLEMGDHLGSTNVVVDRTTSELVQRTTYQPYGATESDYRPDRWRGFREDYRFTGKEEDVELGVTYFGKRYLSPYLGRWMTPDPLAVHAPGEADLNLYAYVSGAALKSTDPDGLTPPEFKVEMAAGKARNVARALSETWNAANKWVSDVATTAFFRAWGTTEKEYRANFERSTRPSMGPVKQPTLIAAAGDGMVKGSPAAAGQMFMVMSVMAFGPKGALPAPSLGTAAPWLERILGPTYARLVTETGSEGAAMVGIHRQATVVARFVDGTGKVRTVAATANREVWSDLSKARAAGELGELELLPFVSRPNKDAPHPDVVLADFARSQGASGSTFASVPKTCEACQVAIPAKLPSASIETPKQ